MDTSFFRMDVYHHTLMIIMMCLRRSSTFREGHSCAALALLSYNAIGAYCRKSKTLCRNDNGWGLQGHGFKDNDNIIYKPQIESGSRRRFFPA